MKRAKNLWEEIISVENILKAHKNARKGKSHYKSVRMVDNRPYHFARNIRRILKNRQWIPTAYTPMTLTERGKEREILKVNYYPDRIIHHAIMQVVQPILEQTFIKDTYQSIKGRGIHAGVLRIRSWLKDEVATRYALKIDIKKYYPSVDNEILKGLLRKKIGCKETLFVLDRLVDSAKGLPIGNYTSQTFGNFYLSYLDHYIKEDLKVKHYIRYADDIVLFSDNKEDLHRHRVAISRYIKEHLNLTMKSNHQIFPTRTRGLDFLGYRFFGNYILLRKSISKKIKRALKREINSLSDVGRVMSYYGWMLWADAYNFARVILLPTFFSISKVAKIQNIKNPVAGIYIVPKLIRARRQLTLF